MSLQILIVEDDVVNRCFLTELLGGQGHQCHPIGSVNEARRLLAEGRFDLCLADIQLPDGRGDSLRDCVGPQRLLLMSGDPPPVGATDWLQKPIDLAQLARWLSLPGSLVSGNGRGVKPDGQAILLDDAAAARALGAGLPSLPGLRRLLASELERELPRLAEALTAGQTAPLAAGLHRLQAACALCGASDLQRRGGELLGALQNPDLRHVLWCRYAEAAQQLVPALRA